MKLKLCDKCGDEMKYDEIAEEYYCEKCNEEYKKERSKWNGTWIEPKVDKGKDNQKSKEKK